MQPADVADELDLRHYLDVLKRRRLVVVAAVIVVVAIAMGLTLRQTPRYAAKSEVLLRQSTSEEILGNPAVQTNSAAVRIAVATEIEYMTSRSVADAVEQTLGFAPRVTGGTDLSAVLAIRAPRRELPSARQGA